MVVRITVGMLQVIEDQDTDASIPSGVAHLTSWRGAVTCRQNLTIPRCNVMDTCIS